MKYHLECAKLSAIVYKDSKTIQNFLINDESFAGATNFTFYDQEGTQALSFLVSDKLYIAFRGTEPTQLSDIWADLKAWQVKSKYKSGRVHAGFRSALDEIWEILAPTIISQASGREVIITGHSLGAALATLCCKRLSKLIDNKITLYTFGSPRVGSRRWAKKFDTEAYRFVNNNDIVTRVPSPILYRHVGQLCYFNHYGNVRNMGYWQRLKDRWRGFWKALIKRQGIDWFIDHSMVLYLKKVENNDELLHSGR